MEMLYRGVRYQSHATNVKLAENQANVTTLKYRGCPYQLNQSAISLPQSSAQDLVYRGISVTTGKEIRFLGSTCAQKKIVLAPMGV
jgi:hypothetical protein